MVTKFRDQRSARNSSSHYGTPIIHDDPSSDSLRAPRAKPLSPILWQGPGEPTDFPPGYFSSHPICEQNIRPDTTITENSSADVDISTWSDLSDSDTVLDLAGLQALGPFREDLVKSLMDKFHAHQQGIRTWTPSSQGNAAATSSRSSEPADKETSRALGHNSLNKNSSRQPGRDGEEGGDSNDGRPSRKRALKSPEDVRDRLLACPFCKNNPRRYRKCNTFVLRDISRVK